MLFFIMKNVYLNNFTSVSLYKRASVIEKPLNPSATFKHQLHFFDSASYQCHMI